MSETDPEIVAPPRPTALFLDDDADILAAAELVLRRGDFDLVKVQTPEAARAVLDTQAVDVLLLDLNFRRGDTSGEAGLAFLRERLAATPHLVVVVVTSHSGMAIAIEAMRLGAQDFVVKPWHNERFLATVRAAIDNLNDDEVGDVIALAWLGRGDYDEKGWGEARMLARQRQEEHSSDYLLGMPALGDYLEEGLSMLGYPTGEIGSAHL